MPTRSSDKVHEYDLARILGVNPRRLSDFLIKNPGEKVEEGELIAEKKGWRRRFFVSPFEGRIVSFTDEGLLKISSQKDEVLNRFRSGEKKKSKEGQSVKAGFGADGEGELVFFEEEIGLFDLIGDFEGKVIAYEGRISMGFWHKSLTLGASGFVCTTLGDEDLAAKLEKEKIPLLLLDGKDSFWDALKRHRGKTVRLDGVGKQIILKGD